MTCNCKSKPCFQIHTLMSTKMKWKISLNTQNRFWVDLWSQMTKWKRTFQVQMHIINKKCIRFQVSVSYNIQIKLNEMQRMSKKWRKLVMSDHNLTNQRIQVCIEQIIWRKIQLVTHNDKIWSPEQKCLVQEIMSLGVISTKPRKNQSSTWVSKHRTLWARL